MTKSERAEQERKPNFADLFTEAQNFSDKGNYEQAIIASTTCLEISRRETITTLFQLGKDLRMARHQHLAVPVFEEAEGLATRTGDNRLILKAIVDKVDALRTGNRDPEFPYPEGVQTEKDKMTHRFREIPDLLNRAQSLMGQLSENETTIDAYNQFGLVFDEAENFAQSAAVYQEAETVSRRLLVQNPQGKPLLEKLARATHLRGRALVFLGDYQKAKELEEESLGISLQQDNLRNSGNTRITLGDAELGLGNNDAARKVWQEAGKKAEKENDKEIFDLANDRLAKLQNLPA